jgi:hypothetical protein
MGAIDVAQEPARSLGESAAGTIPRCAALNLYHDHHSCTTTTFFLHHHDILLSD